MLVCGGRWMATRCCAGDAHDLRVMSSLLTDQSAFTLESPGFAQVLVAIVAEMQLHPGRKYRRLACRCNCPLSAVYSERFW